MSTERSQDSLLPELAPAENIAAAQLRGQLLLEQTIIDEAAKDGEIIDYTDCTNVYASLGPRHQAAESRFMSALGETYKIKEEFADTTRRWHALLEQKQLGSGAKVDIVHKVQARTGEGRLSNYHDSLSISTYLLHKLIYDAESIPRSAGAHFLHGNYEGHFIIPGNRLGGMEPWPVDELRLRSFSEIKDEVKEELQEVGRRAMLATFAEQLANIKEGFDVKEDKSIFQAAGQREILGLSDACDIGHLIVGRVLLECIPNKHAALDILTDAFSPDYFPAFFRVLTQPMSEQSEEVARFNLARRFAWLNENLTSMRRAACNGARNEVIFNFANFCKAALQTEQQKIDRLNALAAKYESMENISRCMPGSFSE